jgi:mono/diheme cytochrome c family protein
MTPTICAPSSRSPRLARCAAMRVLVPAIAALAAIGAAEDAATLYTTNVAPLLAEHCVSCHGPKKTKSGLRLDSRDAIIKGGKTMGAGIVPGKPEESPIVTVCSLPRSDDMAMPPDGSGEPLTAEQIGWLSAWIVAEGATAPKAAP